MNATATTSTGSSDEDDVFTNDEFDSFGLALPDHWIMLPLARGEFDRTVDGLRRAWRRNGMSRTDQRRGELLLQRARRELVDEGITFAAATFEKARRDGVEQVEENSEWLMSICTFSVVTARQLGTEMRLSIPILYRAFTQRPNPDNLARITDLCPPEIDTLPAGRAVRLRRLYESTELASRLQRWFGETYVVPIGTTGGLVGMLQFTTTNVELAQPFSELYHQLAQTMTFFRPDDPTEFNSAPADDEGND